MSIFIYISCYAVATKLFASAIRNKKKKYRMRLFLASLPLALFSGLRFETGRDYYSYVRNFELIGAGLNSRLEVGFQQINKIVYSLGLSPQYMFFVSSLIMMLFIYFGLNRKKNDIPIVWGLFAFLMLFYQSSFNLVRLMLATSIMFYNIKNVEERRFLKFAVYTIIASTMHFTSIIFLPLYFIYNNIAHQNKLWKKLVLYLAVVLISLNLNQIIQMYFNYFEDGSFDYYSKYVKESNSISLEALQQALFYFPLMLFGMFKYKKAIRLDSKFHIYFSLTVVGTIILITSIFMENYVYRLADYFLIFNIITIPTYVKVIKKDKDYLSLFVLLSLLVFYWVSWYFIIGAHGTSVYKAIFKMQ